MSTCVYLKQKMNRTLFCKKLNKQINISNCSNCKYKEFKSYKQLQQKKEYKYLPGKGKCNRYYNNVSIMPKSNLYYTFKIKGCHKHHIFGGVVNRPKSEKYGLFIWLTPEQHRYFHEHPLEMVELKKTAQTNFMENYNITSTEFIKMFGRSYL